uniref:Uncharacterized protein n=1 Tax=Cannabis sativa TaxID=3483 RepID=A0A803QXB9_CANSA
MRQPTEKVQMMMHLALQVSENVNIQMFQPYLREAPRASHLEALGMIGMTVFVTEESIEIIMIGMTVMVGEETTGMTGG